MQDTNHSGSVRSIDTEDPFAFPMCGHRVRLGEVHGTDALVVALCDGCGTAWSRESWSKWKGARDGKVSGEESNG